MIDCSKTKNYFAEKARMTKRAKNGLCKLGCSNCPLCSINNNKGQSCTAFEMLYPEKAIEIVQKWSNEHPQKTYLSEFLKNYPNAELNHGVPRVCLKKLGAVSGCAKTKKGDLCISCYSCWNQSIEEREKNGIS
jgi:hypothetical protein|nr:MAG TPA: hypothetical protein [Caudoviricetes sp.]